MVVGVTGGVATGKSLVTSHLRSLGAIVFSADEAARAILTPGGSVLRQIAETFGADTVSPEGRLDRARLAERAFADVESRKKLNRITHPPILRLLRAQMEAAQSDFPPETVVVVEVPLLFESKMEDWFEQIVVVTASESMQIARLRQRNGLDEAEARRRIVAQMPLAEKVALATVVLPNDGTLDAIRQATESLWRGWMRPQTPDTR